MQELINLLLEEAEKPRKKKQAAHVSLTPWLLNHYGPHDQREKQSSLSLVSETPGYIGIRTPKSETTKARTGLTLFPDYKEYLETVRKRVGKNMRKELNNQTMEYMGISVRPTIQEYVPVSYGKYNTEGREESEKENTPKDALAHAKINPGFEESTGDSYICLDNSTEDTEYDLYLISMKRGK